MIIVCYKPYGYLSQFTPELGSSWKTLSELELPANVYPVGRLDADSEGMLVLSDEHEIVAQLLEPANGHPRTYWAHVEHNADQDRLLQLERGVVIQGYQTKPCKARIIQAPEEIVDRIPPIRERKSVPTSWIELELTEGRNRQVRRMTAAVGHPTLRLIRVRIGSLDLLSLNLRVGRWCVLTHAQRLQLLQRPKGATNRKPKSRNHGDNTNPHK